MYYINLKNGSQHTIPTDITNDEAATEYAVNLCGRYPIMQAVAQAPNAEIEIINENTGENILS